MNQENKLNAMLEKESTTLDGLYLLEKINANALKVDNEIVEFYKTQKALVE